MPKQMSFDSFGINFPESYWEVAHINISLIDKQGSITFFGYANKKARENGDRMIANKTYRVTPQVFADYFPNIASESELVSGSYAMAENIKDTVIGKDGQTYSFFNNATNV